MGATPWTTSVVVARVGKGYVCVDRSIVFSARRGFNITQCACVCGWMDGRMQISMQDALNARLLMLF